MWRADRGEREQIKWNYARHLKGLEYQEMAGKDPKYWYPVILKIKELGSGKEIKD